MEKYFSRFYFLFKAAFIVWGGFYYKVIYQKHYNKKNTHTTKIKLKFSF